jgi:ligand-binding sensor domain-containing protein
MTTLLHLPALSYGDIMTDSAGGVWVMPRQLREGLMRIEGNRVTRLRSAVWPQNAPTTTLQQTPDGSMWVTTEGVGLFRIRDSTVTAVSVTGVAQTTITSLLQDREGSLWVGTSTRGLHQLTRTSFQGIAPVNKLSMSTDGLAIDQTGTLWAGLGCDGLLRVRGPTAVNIRPSSWCIWSLLPDHDGKLWLGSSNGPGLSRWSEGSAPQPVPGFAGQNVSALYRDTRGTLWVGTREHGLAELRNGTFIRRTKDDGLPSNDVRVIEDDGHGGVWVGSGGAVAQINGKVIRTVGPSQGLPGDAVRALYHDRDDRLWIGTYGGGLSVLDKGKVVTLRVKDGLPEDIVSLIVEDSGSFWLTGNRGVHRLARTTLLERIAGDPAPLHAISYGAADGLSNPETNGGFQPAGARDQEGALWIPTMGGPVRVQLHDVPRNIIPPPVYIDAVLLDGQPVSTKDLVVPSNVRRIEIRYAALSFRNPEAVHYRVQLHPYDSGWTDVDRRRNAQYTNIPPGRQLFRVIASSEDGIWSPTGATLAFRVQPHVIQTIWFRALVAVAFIGLAIAASIWRTARLRAHARQLKQEVSEALSQLKILRGLLPICSSCKKVRDDHGYWNQIEEYIRDRSEAEFSHSLCEDCIVVLYPELQEALVPATTVHAETPGENQQGQ